MVRTLLKKICVTSPRLDPNMANGANVDRDQAQTGRGTDQEADLNKWLPVTASRKAKWWYSAFHNVTAMVGAGILGLPFAISQLGWYIRVLDPTPTDQLINFGWISFLMIPGIVSILGSWLITFYSLWQLVELHEAVPGKRFDRYHELGQHAFGEKLGYWIVVPQQACVQAATTIVYSVTGGKSLKKFFDLLIPSANGVRQTYFILMFSCLQLVISQTPNFNSLKGISLLAAVMSLCYALVAFVASTIRGSHNDHHLITYGVRSHSTGGQIFDALNALGTVAFAFAAHSVALEIQATIPSSPQKPSKKPMWRGCLWAYIIVAFCYLSVSISGFWAFGNAVDDDILVSLEKPRLLIAIANLMVFFHVLGSYQVFAMPLFDLLESFLVLKLHFTPGRALRLIGRSTYVALAGFIAMCVPFFGGLLGFFGGLVFTSTSFFLPCIIWLIIRKPKTWSFHWVASWVSIILGVMIAVFAPIGGLRQIIVSAKTYKIFS